MANCLHFLYLMILVVEVVKVVKAHIRYLPGLPPVYERHGNLTLGIVVPVHKYDADLICSSRIRELGTLQRVEAMVFAIDEINSNSSILPNHTLGFKLLDDCSKDTTALVRSLHFIQTIDNETYSTEDLAAYRVAGVIGSESSRNSVQMADMLSIFKVPMLSYISTSPVLSDKNVYPYFSRIVPSDVLQAKAIVDILNRFQWTYISVVYAEGSYGTMGFQAVKTRVEESGSCLAVTREMRQSFTDEDYDHIIKELLDTRRAKVVVVFSPLSQARELLKSAERNHATGNFTWIGSDAWGRNIQDYNGVENAALGALTIKFYSPVIERFDNHFKYLTAANASQNPWIKDYISAHFKCSFNDSAADSKCNNSMNFVPGYKPEITVSLVMDAVYAYARALHNILSTCKEAMTSPQNCIDGDTMVKTLRNITFQGAHGEVGFDEFGDGVATYELQNVQFVNNTYSLQSVGHWDSRKKIFTEFRPTDIRWNTADFKSPVSTCSDPCDMGYQAVVTQPHCCWYCQKCRDNERTVMREGLAKCEICPKAGNFTWPNAEDKTRCELIPPTIVSVNDFTGVLIVAFDIFTILMTIVTTVLYVLNNKEKLIKASSRELSYLILGGVFISSIIVTFFLVSPTDVICTITDFGFHMSFTFSYGPLLVKTNRIYRIFTSGKKSKKRPPFIDSKYQIIFAVVTILIQIVILTVSTIIHSPIAVTQMPSLAEPYVEITCKIPEVGFLCSLVYNLMLVLMCTFHAVKTRKLPDNFNESKFISFCVYTTIVLWIAFIPTYFTTTKTTYRAMFLSLAMLANSIVTIFFLFVPKLYALYLVSVEKQHVAAATSTLRTVTNDNRGLSNLPKPNGMQVVGNAKVSPIV
ncbi:metabotropic glutamate receptor 3 [Patella vulgata]|uniref:metabotropic glutamate receptor 3 n=1 Tax=Patella vulgata TaxID=6465 RepID=UPI0021802CD2|nr:metabotropic glutamate receptor 3 [Patella vulgata]XP_050390962.1 metabotropic glutamate receptor 3 [Patella vulgata]